MFPTLKRSSLRSALPHFEANALVVAEQTLLEANTPCFFLTQLVFLNDYCAIRPLIRIAATICSLAEKGAKDVMLCLD